MPDQNAEAISPAPPATAIAIKEFGRRVCHYFRAFLETDFKRQQTPRRRIQLKNDAGFRTGFNLRKYPTLFQAAWALATKAPGDALELRIAPRQHVASISPTLHRFIVHQVEAIPSDRFEELRAEALRLVEKETALADSNPEQFVETVQIAFAELISERLVAPLLSGLEGAFKQQAYSAVESVFEIESDLVDSLANSVVEQLPIALAAFVARRDKRELESVLRDCFVESATRQKIIDFFAAFATADAYAELRDLMQYLSTGNELQLYLYLGDMRFATRSYPLFYLPLSARLEDNTAAYVLKVDPPHLYVNKRAIDYVHQELRGEAARNSISPITERIIYLDGETGMLGRIEDVVTRLVPAFGLSEPLRIAPPFQSQTQTSQLRLSTSGHLAVFDKADESLINDFEALLAVLDGNAADVQSMFIEMVQQILLGEPASIEAQVAAAWEALPVAERLVAVAPIPVSEEQQKILVALQQPQGRFIQVIGPPGTGKSHTISAIAFDCILHEKSVLILSDKKEALDVVQDKLEQTLARVRFDEASFPNPILRLGKGSQSNYPKLIQQQARQKIERHVQAHRTNETRVQQELAETRDKLQRQVTSTISTLSGVTLSRLQALHRLEAELEHISPDIPQKVQRNVRGVHGLPAILAAIPANAAEGLAELVGELQPGTSLGSVEELLRLQLASESLFKDPPGRLTDVVRVFPTLDPADAQSFVKLAAEYEQLRMPLFGFFFRKKQVMALNARIAAEFSAPSAVSLHSQLNVLRAVPEVLDRMQRALKSHGVAPSMGHKLYGLAARGPRAWSEVEPVHELAKASLRLLDGEEVRALAVGDTTTGWHDLLGRLKLLGEYAASWDELQQALDSVPLMDYLGQKDRLQTLYTSTMAHTLDSRFLSFVQNNSATAKTLGTVIKRAERFPVDAFEKLKTAMPCVIASVREFAEYVPLARNVFDVVIIDEGSQVSVAQAFPALLRARKVVVFGDPKQFSNTKSMQASLMTNAGYLSDMRDHFTRNISSASDRIARLEMFDVKKSILEFMELIRSFSIMLRKHFRGYPELISFSSKYFYDGELQAIKVRGKPIDEVIKFTVVDSLPENRAQDSERRGWNRNAAEAEFILQELRRMIDEDELCSVGIITPHTEQQAYLTRILANDAYGQDFVRKLRLKIMTFDSCQGEEREMVFYSMVATPLDDKLNYIFPVELSSGESRVEEMLKMQRLNVGFSRAQETIHFVLSKPVEGFTGSIRKALQHYQEVLNSAGRADSTQTDPRSPMERKVLQWLQQTEVFQKHEEDIELIPQFPVGDYLRQLDPTYQHPAYRVDFLLRFVGEDDLIQIVIEYDGLKEHFEQPDQVHAGNYESLYRESDVEREFVLESYGYRFLRINRFNMGADPVRTLNLRLKDLLGSALNPKAPQSVAKVIEQAEDLQNGEAKLCTKCERVIELEAFFDPTLGSGKGGFGRICMQCKMPSRSVRSRKVFRRRRG